MEYVYLLRGWNTPHGQVYKIGMTTRTPEERLSDINRDGYAGHEHWEMLEAWETPNALAAEKSLHKKYRAFQFTYKGNRECFLIPAYMPVIEEITAHINRLPRSAASRLEIMNSRLESAQRKLDNKKHELRNAQRYVEAWDTAEQELSDSEEWKTYLAAHQAAEKYRETDGRVLANKLANITAEAEAAEKASKQAEQDKHTGDVFMGVIYSGAWISAIALLVDYPYNTYVVMGLACLTLLLGLVSFKNRQTANVAWGKSFLAAQKLTQAAGDLAAAFAPYNSAVERTEAAYAVVASQIVAGYNFTVSEFKDADTLAAHRENARYLPVVVRKLEVERKSYLHEIQDLEPLAA